MKVVILAGGFGTRLREIIKDVPKPMALIAGKPFLEHQIRSLQEQGFKDIILCLHYMADAIKSYLGNGKKFGVDITYSEEEMPLGTAGAIKKAQKYIDDTFFVLNGDSFSKLNLKEFLEFHNNKKGIASMSLVYVPDSSPYGETLMEGNKIKSFSEKKDTQSQGGLVNSGVYIFEPKIFDYIEPGKNVSLEKEIFPMLANEGRLFGYSYEGYFIDIGRPETYTQFRKDALEDLMINPEINIREALQKMVQKGKESLLVVNPDRFLLGVLNDHIIRDYFIKGGDLDKPVSEAMVRDLEKVGRVGDSEEKIHEMLLSGTRHLPILDNDGKLLDIRFRVEEIKDNIYPVVRGKSPMRISFAGGGTDIPKFFEEHGGVVINATIDKYCHATIIKRADSKITITSDICPDELILDIRKVDYDRRFDLIKAVIKIMKPDFGFDLHLHNDIPPGRGLGASASLAVLIIKLISQLQGMEYNDNKIAEIAHRAEIDELGIKGGWQDQYSVVTGGFNYMEFKKDGIIIYPLKLKDSTINELATHLSLCYVGESHYSGEHQEALERTMSEEDIAAKLKKMKDIAIETKDALLNGNLLRIGELLHESWKNKKELDTKISNPKIDELYDIAIKNGAYGGKLLGAGGGGYLLFHHPPEKRCKLIRALENAGGEIMKFNFDSKGAEIWVVKR